MAAKPWFGFRSTALVLAAASLAALALAARADAFIYWASMSGTIARANLDGSGVNEKYITGLYAPWGVAVNGQYIYLSDGASVARANLDGTGFNHFFSCDLRCPEGIGSYTTGVAVNSSSLYDVASFGDAGAQIVRSVLATGHNTFYFSPQGMGATYGVAANDDALYWTDVAEHAIGHLETPGGRIPVRDSVPDYEFITGANFPTGLAVDRNFIYWANEAAGTIGRANLDGTGVNQSFITGAIRPTGVAVDGNYIYWGNAKPLGAPGGTIARANLDGSGVNENFIATSQLPTGVAVDGLGATCAGREATVVGTGRSDTLRGTSGNDVIAALGGDDTVVAGRGDDLICGGAGADVISGGRGADTIRGGRGNDVLRGGRGEDKLDGGAGSDALNGGAGDDLINSRDGRRDTVDCAGGKDTVRAGKRDRLRHCEQVRR